VPVDPMEAFGLFYKDNSGPVFRALLAGTLNRAAAEDATAEAFARALAHWDRVASHPNPKAWVLRVAWNHHRSSWRRWEARWSVDRQEPSPRAAESWVDPDLVAAIRGLPRGQREVIVLLALRACASRRSWAAAGAAVPAIVGPGAADEPATDDGGMSQC
jgi:DNA-directed RNA polymerase specialized sigma24 family protein